MARPDILVINPNSNLAVTAALDAALVPLRFADGVDPLYDASRKPIRH